MPEIQIDIRRTAMDLLARREHSRLELAQKLLKRFSDQQEQIEIEIDRLEAEGLQSDTRLAEAFIRARTSRGQGPSKVKMELKGKGVSDEVISLCLESCGIDWFELAQQVAQKKFSRLFDEAGSGADVEDVEAMGIAARSFDMKTKAKISRFLQQRGFSFDQISSVY